MTFCKQLKTAKIGNETITAYENYEKFSTVPYYEIIVSREEIALEVIKTAKTTWRKKFNQIMEEKSND